MVQKSLNDCNLHDPDRATPTLKSISWNKHKIKEKPDMVYNSLLINRLFCVKMQFSTYFSVVLWAQSTYIHAFWRFYTITMHNILS